MAERFFLEELSKGAKDPSADIVMAIIVKKKVGFRQEGVMRQALFRQGRYHDVILMGILKDEYRP
jgi:L-amino acid N-acyltransferase YncA